MALGASLAALVEELFGSKKGMGQYAYAATPSGGGVGPSLGPIVGPPAPGPAAPSIGPLILPLGPEEEEAPGPVISVEPERAGPGASFFGVSAPFYFWPWAWPWRPWGWRPLTLVCEKKTVDDREVLECRTPPPRLGPVAVAWGPPGWFW